MRCAIIVFSLLSLVFGCASVREGARGVLGVSVKVLEESKPRAAAKTFAFGLGECSTAVEEELAAAGTYIYARDPGKHLIAVYVSPRDTTPVGIFLEPVDKATTKVLVSSPSSPARDLIAGKLFTGLDLRLLEGKNVKVKLDRSPGESD